MPNPLQPTGLKGPTQQAIMKAAAAKAAEAWTQRADTQWDATHGVKAGSRTDDQIDKTRGLKPKRPVKRSLKSPAPFTNIAAMQKNKHLSQVAERMINR